MQRYVEWVVRFPRTVIATAILVTVFFALQIRNLEVIIEGSKTLPAHDSYVQVTEKIERLFGLRYVAIIGVTPKDGDAFSPNVLKKVQRLTASLLKMPGVLRGNVFSLAAPRIKAITGTADGMEVRPLLERMPQTAEEIEALRRTVRAHPAYLNSIVSRDGRTAAILVELTDQRGYRPVVDKITSLVDQERDDTVDIVIGGSPAYVAALETQSQRMAFLFPIAVLIVGLIHYEAFRTLQGLFLPLLTALLAVLWATGIMGWAGVPMDVVNATTPILILAVAAGHAVQILKRYYEEYHRIREASSLSPAAANRAAVVASMTRIGPVMLTAGSVAASGFLSLALFPIAMIRTFGIFAGFGILSALVVEMTFTPALRSLLPAPRETERQRPSQTRAWDRVTQRIAGWVTGPGRWRILGGAALFLLFSIVGATFVVSDNSFVSYFSSDAPFPQADRMLNRLLGGTYALYLFVHGDEEGIIQEPNNLRAMEATQKFLQQRPHVGKALSLVDFIERMNQAMHEEDRAYYRVPDDRNLIAQYLLLYSMSGEPTDFDIYVDSTYRAANIQVYLDTDSSAVFNELVAALQGFLATQPWKDVRIEIGGIVAQTASLNAVVARGKILNIVQIGVVILVVTSLVFRSLVAGLLVLTPLILAALANFGLMGWTGISLNVGTSVISAMAVGVGADYAIYLIYRLREDLAGGMDEIAAVRHTLITAGQAILFVALAIASGYGVLLLSYQFRFYMWFGILIANTMLVSCLAALTVLPSLILVLKPRFVFGAHQQVARPAANHASRG